MVLSTKGDDVIYRELLVVLKECEMPTDIPVDESPKSPRPKGPNWPLHLKKRKAYLLDAVALSMNLSPKSVPRFLASTRKTQINAFDIRLEDARLEMTPNGAITVIEKGSEVDGSDWIIDLKSFVAFAVERGWGVNNENFKKLGGQGDANSAALAGDKKVHKAPITFVAALIRILVEIAKRAAKAEEDFDVKAMPGTKKELYELAMKFDYFPTGAFKTFDSYIKGLCQFKQGARKTDFYRNLFPEKLNTP